MGESATKSKAEESEATPRTKTRYIVLQVQGDSVAPIGEGEGLNDVQAIGEVAGALGLNEGEFVAVPARSWRVRSVSVQTRQTVSIR